jgi:hypothetical protein
VTTQFWALIDNSVNLYMLYYFTLFLYEFPIFFFLRRTVLRLFKSSKRNSKTDFYTTLKTSIFFFFWFFDQIKIHIKTMASVPVVKGKQISGSGAVRRKNNLPTRLDIPTTSLTPTSSAPSSLSPLIVPATNTSGGSSATQQQQRLTTELIDAIGGGTTPQPEDDGDILHKDKMIIVSAPDGEDSFEINPTNLKELVRLGEGAGGTVTKVENVVTGFILAKKVR